MSEISVSILAYDETENLKGLLNNIKDFASEIVVVDSSPDGSVRKVAQNYTNKIFERENLMNLNINKQYGIEKCTKEWIIYLDPDERLTDELKKEIKEKISNTEFNAFSFPRINVILGKPLKFGGHYPDTQLRLFRNGYGRFLCKHVHEKIKIDGKIGRLKNSLLHYPNPSIKEFIQKLDFYSEFNCQFAFENGEKPSLLKGFVSPFFRFLRKFILQAGFLDGFPGFVSLFFSFINKTVIHIKLWEKYRISKNE
ncbi:MAG: glycosyltransferase family 2 protein [Elusimicrobia bacterium]|nr:glycosyltransferase family 2 protein [Elusimicrobiota bacterium]